MAGGLEAFDARATYGAAARDYEDASSDYWQFLARRTVARLGVTAGDAVLDVACGSGAAAIPAAEAALPTGHVTGVDVAEEMLAIARGQAKARDLDVQFLLDDMTHLSQPEKSFDVVMCVLGIFFVDDMPEAARAMWRCLRPGGRLGITVMGTKFFTPMTQTFLDTVHAEAPELQITLPWTRTEDPEVLRGILVEGGIPNPHIDVETEHLAFPDASEWWRIVMGTGLRRVVIDLGEDAAARVRKRCEEWARERRVDRLELTAIYATAKKPL